MKQLEKKLFDEGFLSSHPYRDWIRYELNFLELHDLDEYVLFLLQSKIKTAGNPNNSSILFVLGITDTPPIDFIKTVGGSAPDVDTDFQHTRRNEIFEYLQKKYGSGFAHIGTVGYSKAKGILKDVCRIYNVPFDESNRITKFIPDLCESLKDALAESKEFKELYEASKGMQEIIDLAISLEGTIKSVGIHACIGPDATFITRCGPERMCNLSGTTSEILTPHGWRIASFYETGTKKLVEYKIAGSKYSNVYDTIPLTEDHLVQSDDGSWIKAGNFEGKVLNSETFSVDPFYFLAGWMWNDGYIKPDMSAAYVYFTPAKDDDAYNFILEHFELRKTTLDAKFFVKKEYATLIVESFGDGILQKNKIKEPPSSEIFDYLEKLRGWLSGILSANCTIQRGEIRFKVVSKPLIDFVVSALRIFGIEVSYLQKVKGKKTLFQNGEYECSDLWEFGIGRQNTFRLNNIIGIIQEYKKSKIFKISLHNTTKTKSYDSVVYDFTIHTNLEDERSAYVNGVVVHNCGVVLDDNPISNNIPVWEAQGQVATQYDGETCEKLGYIKVDILGLKCLSILSRTRELILENHGIDIDYYALPLDDKLAYDLLHKGDTLGVFQLEGSSVAPAVSQVAPDNIHDISALLSIWR